jgi:hypothetical protein
VRGRCLIASASLSLALSLGGCGSGGPDGASGPVNPGGAGGSGGGGDGGSEDPSTACCSDPNGPSSPDPSPDDPGVGDPGDAGGGGDIGGGDAGGGDGGDSGAGDLACIRYHLVRLGQAAWIAVHVRNPAIGVARVDVLAQGRWARLRRAAGGVFAAPTAVGGGPFVFRVMDVHGHTAVDRGVPLVESQETAGADRLSMCAP